MRPSLRRLGLLALGLLAWQPIAFAASHADGDTVVVSGVVSDAAGAPVPGVQVVLDVTREGFRISAMGRRAVDGTRRWATTDARGHYSIEWTWDRYFNHFDLVTGVPGGPGGRLEVLERYDITPRMTEAGPIVVPVTVTDTDRLKVILALAASPPSDEQRRVYDELGRPDRIDSGRYGEHEEASWWYFAAGKVARFRDGRLVETADFAPVRPF